jgi:hypothetical protein
LVLKYKDDCAVVEGYEAAVLDDVDVVVCATEEIAKQWAKRWAADGCATDINQVRVRTTLPQ